MSLVIIRQTDYDYSSLRPAVFEILDILNNNNVIHNRSRVLIKPNLLAPAAPEKAIVTHPLVIRAAVEYVLSKGAIVKISDSPAVGSFEKILEVSGIKSALEGLDVEYKELKKSIFVDVGEPFKKIEIAEDAVKADVLINLPKLKTHAQMLLTLGVKNLFGCITGLKKPEWHLRTGEDRNTFAQLLVKIYEAVSPQMTVIDGVLAMEGQGPGKGGTPRALGIILGSTEAASADIAVCKMLGINYHSLLTNKIMLEQRLADKDIRIDGIMPRVKDFVLPEIAPVIFGPARFHGFMRKHMTQRPVCDDSLCKLCGECWQYCPAKAITNDREKIHFDYDKCIRCYCCIEVCPFGSLKAKETMAGKAMRKLLKIK